MMYWELRPLEPIYLCERHADKLVRSVNSREGSLATTSELVGDKSPAGSESPTKNQEIEGAQPEALRLSGSPADTQAAETKGDLSVRVPVLDLTNDEPAKSSVHEAVGNVVREDFEAHGTALQDESSSTGAEGKQSEIWDLGRMCRSRKGQPCTSEATVHCPTCGAWFCDAHAEDEEWHPCVIAGFGLNNS